MANTSTKKVTISWKDKEDGTADISFDGTVKGSETAQVLLGGLLAVMGIEDHKAVVDIVRTLNKYSNGGGVTKKVEGENNG